MAQLFAMLAGIDNKMDEMNKKMDAHTQAFISDARALRGERRQLGQCLQAGIMAPPRAGMNELGGSATAVRPATEAGGHKIIWGTCWARSIRVTEEATVTVTEREKLIGVTETCTREIRHEVTEIKRTTEVKPGKEVFYCGICIIVYNLVRIKVVFNDDH